MNLWRWLGVAVFLFGAFTLIGAANLSALAQDKGGDKDKTVKDKADDKSKKPDDKGAKPDDKSKKPDDKGAKPDDKTKKPDDKGAKPDDKSKAPPVTGDKVEFKAFDPKQTKVFYQKQYTKTKQVMTVMSQKVEQNQEQTFLIQWTPQDPDKDGNWVVKQKIVGVKMKIDIGGNNIKYDSTEKNPKNPMTDFFDALTKEELSFTIAKDLTVKSVDNAAREKFVKNLVDINPQMQGLLKAILSDKALSKMAEPTWWAYPPGGAFPKEWDRSAKLELGPIGDYTTKFHFTYKGEKSGKDTVGIKTTLTYSAPESKAGLPFVIQKADLKGENGEGEAIFDRAKGRFESTNMKMKLTGKLTIEVGNMNTEVELNQDQESSSLTYDDMPADWKAKQ